MNQRMLDGWLDDPDVWYPTLPVRFAPDKDGQRGLRLENNQFKFARPLHLRNVL